MKIVSVFLIFLTHLNAQEATFGPEIEFRSAKALKSAAICGSITAAGLPFLINELTKDSEELTKEDRMIINSLSALTGAYLSGITCEAIMKDMEIVKFKKYMRLYCLETKNCSVMEEGRHFRVQYPNGWYWEVTKDDYVMEIKAKPATIETLSEVVKRVEVDLYQQAQRMGFYIPYRIDKFTGGHLSIGIKAAFNNDAILLRNFIVDFINHDEIASGILSKDYGNAKPYLRDIHQYEKLEEIISKFDRGEISGNQFYLALSELDRNFSFNIHDGLLEIRALRSQKKFEDFLLQTKLFKGRIEYLKTLDGPVELIKWGQAIPTSNHQAMATNFAHYVRESGQELNDYLHLIPEKYHLHFQKVMNSFLFCLKRQREQGLSN